MFGKIKHLYYRLVVWLQFASPVADLGIRLWVAEAFWRAGLVKIESWDSTLYLFENEYQVPLLPPDLAAYLGTGVELVLPVLLAFGLFGRLSAGMLFVYNIIAVISYPALWPDGFWHGLIGSAFADHKVWGLMLLVTFLHGPGKLSVDHLLTWMFPGLRKK